MKLRLRALRRTTHFVEDGQNMTGEIMPTLTAEKNIFKLIIQQSFEDIFVQVEYL